MQVVIPLSHERSFAATSAVAQHVFVAFLSYYMLTLRVVHILGQEGLEVIAAISAQHN